MKKLMLCAVALLFGAVGFAQVTDSSGNTAPEADVIDPINPLVTTANAGLSIQNGNANKVRVRQAGTAQSVYTVQDDGSTGVGGNDAFVRQTGAVSAASGVENAAEVRQSGEANDSRTIQEGDFNEAVTHQGQNDDASSGNKAWIQQGTGQQAENNYGAITQDGSTNQATTLQTWDNNEAWTQQTGTDNKSMINQNGSPEDSDGHFAVNEQEGDRNESYIGQGGAGARNSARAIQGGNDNQAKQTQVATDVSGGVGNSAGIDQGIDGPRRSVAAPEAITQWAAVAGNVDSNAGSLVYIPPTEGNKAAQTQVGSGNSAGIFQLGGNVGASNYGEQNQDGDDNNAGMVQTHYFSNDPSNYAKQDQQGNTNTAGLAQEGSGHKSLQSQIGERNTSLAYQQGKSQKLNTHQFGDDNVAYATQSGDCNAALIVQYDGQSYTVEQNKGVNYNDFSVGHNQADILQMGPDGDFGAGTVDCYFDDPMDLDMDYTVPDLNLPDICPDCD